MKKVQSNIFEATPFLRFPQFAVDLKTEFSSEYYSLTEQPQKDGVKEVITKEPYPITPEYVRSFAESCDYRLDPAGAIARSTPRANLGDIRDFQSVSSLDSSQAQSVSAELQERIHAAIAAYEKEHSQGNVSSVEEKEGE